MVHLIELTRTIYWIYAIQTWGIYTCVTFNKMQNNNLFKPKKKKIASPAHLMCRHSMIYQKVTCFTNWYIIQCWLFFFVCVCVRFINWNYEEEFNGKSKNFLFNLRKFSPVVTSIIILYIINPYAFCFNSSSWNLWFYNSDFW